jgi:hypothetical protein
MPPLTFVLIIVLIILLLGAGWGYRTGWHAELPSIYNYGFSGIGVALVILIVLLLFGRI